MAIDLSNSNTADKKLVQDPATTTGSKYNLYSSPPSNSSNYTIKPGDTLSQIAASSGTTVAEIMKINPSITNANLIIAGKSLVLPGQSGSKDYSAINSLEEANAAINADQAKNMDEKTATGEPAVRSSITNAMDEIEKTVAPETAKPTDPNYTGALEGYRSQYGVTDLEAELNALRADEADLKAIKTTRTNAERRKTVAQNVIEGKVSETERQENERLVAVQDQINSVNNQLTTKYNVIDTLMKTKQMDYAASVDLYDKELSNNISMFNAAKGIDEANKSDLEREKDDARANAQIVINSMTERGVSYGDLSAGEQSNLTKLGVQSGLGADFFSNIMKAGGNKPILTTITGSDDTEVTIIYKDGTTKKVKTGLTPKVSTATPPEDKTAAETQKMIESISSYSDELDGLMQSKDPNKHINWATAWNRMKKRYPDLTNEKIDEFLGLEYRDKYSK
jgi:hypothetical protein